MQTQILKAERTPHYFNLYPAALAYSVLVPCKLIPHEEHAIDVHYDDVIAIRSGEKSKIVAFRIPKNYCECDRLLTKCLTPTVKGC